jgi:CarD family transcriptional regulator
MAPPARKTDPANASPKTGAAAVKAMTTAPSAAKVTKPASAAKPTSATESGGAKRGAGDGAPRKTAAVTKAAAEKPAASQTASRIAPAVSKKVAETKPEAKSAIKDARAKTVAAKPPSKPAANVIAAPPPVPVHRNEPARAETMKVEKINADTLRPALFTADDSAPNAAVTDPAPTIPAPAVAAAPARAAAASGPRTTASGGATDARPGKAAEPVAPAAVTPAGPSVPQGPAHSAQFVTRMVAPVGQEETFVEGDYVVYPTHGVGKVEKIAIEDIAGHRLELIHITFDENRMTLRVPVAKARTAGLRKLATRKMFDEAMAVLKGKARIKRTMWSRRAQEYEAKINSGDPLTIAEVVRDLHRNAGQPDQSFSERQIYEAAMDRLAAELAALDQTDKLTASAKLANFLKTLA